MKELLKYYLLEPYCILGFLIGWHFPTIFSKRITYGLDDFIAEVICIILLIVQYIIRNNKVKIKWK